MTRDSTIIDYRNPHTPSRAKIDHILIGLRTRQQLHTVKCWSMILCGIPLMFVAPAIIAGVIFGASLHADAKLLVGYWTIFLLCSAIIIPILWLYERQTRGQWFNDEIRDQASDADFDSFGMLRTSSYGEWELRTTAAAWACYVELLLFGPRLPINGIDQLRAARQFESVDMERAAEVVEELLALDQGVPAIDLLRDPDDRATLRAALRYLVHFDWIGTSKDGKRVWLLTEAKRQLSPR